MTRWSVVGAMVLSGCAGLNRPSSRIDLGIPPIETEPVTSRGKGSSAGDRTDAALAAFQAGLLPLAPTGIPSFAELAPRRDGRGVLIAILDSGIDPSAPGLGVTSDSLPKLLDLRDMSGEGEIQLGPVEVIRDSLSLGTLRVLAGGNPAIARAEGIWAGLVAEVRFGYGPGADLDGSGLVGDTLLVVVVKLTEGLRLIADTDLDGSLVDEKLIADYGESRQWFGWSRPGRVPPIGIAVTLTEDPGQPALTLVFDNSGHGTHVAGVAAGHDLYGVAGFNGAAPGAQLLGLKIANNAARATTTGSLRRALIYAIESARALRMPLVINLSFGVGHPAAGGVRIDAMIDSLLSEHPDVVLTAAASNDGPGLNTLGFPATAREVLAVGATMPLVFTGRAPGDPIADPIAWYSSRGGARSGPDLVAPGTAWSVVPSFVAGSEEKSGTSMAAPHVAGLVARLLSGGVTVWPTPLRTAVVHALKVTAKSIPDGSSLDQGAGLPDINAAGLEFAATGIIPELEVVVDDDAGGSALLLPAGAPPSHSSFRLRRTDRGAALRIRIRSNAEWLEIEGGGLRMLPQGGLRVHLAIDSAAFRTPGVRYGEITIEDADRTDLGALAVVPVTARVPLPISDSTGGVVAVHAGGVGRVFFHADSAVGVRLELTTLATEGLALAALHEPDGRPFREIPITQVGHGDGAGVLWIDPDDVRAGVYEVVVIAPPASGVAARIGVTKSPIHLTVDPDTTGPAIVAKNRSLASQVVALRASQRGIERRLLVGSADDKSFESDVVVPGWASQMVVEVVVSDSLWAAMTDMSVTIRTADGRLIHEAPLNYSFGRSRITLPPGLKGRALMLALMPAFVDEEPAREWLAHLTVRFEAGRSVPVDDGGNSADLAAGASMKVGVTPSSWPWSVPVGWQPVLDVVAEVGVGDQKRNWSRKLTINSGWMAPQ